MDPERKVVSIAPPPSDEQAARASYEAVWRELVETKARVAELMNDHRAMARAFQDLERYVQRHVKRLDAVASRIENARG